MPDFSKFKCDQCGACCRALLIEADYVDVMREPRLLRLHPGISRDGLRNNGQCVVLRDTDLRRCLFMRSVGPYLCAIYPTRPRACVAVEPGDAKCQQARQVDRLPVLCDQDGNRPTAAMLEASCEQYELDVSELGIELPEVTDE